MRGTKSRSHEGTKGKAQSRHSRAAFTLTEIMVVIVIIVLLLALAVPAFNLIRGSRSIEGAENQVAAMLGRARADAIGLQKPFGLMFFIDPQQDRVALVEVFAADYPEAGTPTRDVYLDVVENAEWLSLPPGVIAFTLNNGTVLTGNRTSDGYLGYNDTLNGATASKRLGGVILFGGDGQLISNRTWGFRTGTGAGNNTQTQMSYLIGIPAGGNGFIDAGPTPPGTGGVAGSALGFVLCDWESFKHNGGIDDPQMIANGQYTANGNAERGEEQWIDDNGAPMLINRYNGTVSRSE